FLQNEDGTVSTEVKERTYDLKSKEQGRMIQVSITASIPLKEFDYNAEVEMINPVADTVANATFRGADVDWFIKADDLVLKGKDVFLVFHFVFFRLFATWILFFTPFHLSFLLSTEWNIDTFLAYFIRTYGLMTLLISLVLTCGCALSNYR